MRGKRIITTFLCICVMFGGIADYTFRSNAEDIQEVDSVKEVETGLPNNDEIDKNSITIGKENEIKISIMNDFHYFSRELYSECEAFNYDAKAEKKLLLESDAILNKAIEHMKKEKPDVVLIGGDMSKDGERINHEMVAQKLKIAEEELHQAGVNTKFYVTNGNHDVNANSRDYSSGQTVKIPSVTTKEFKEIYKDFGYGADSKFYTTQENVGGGLSYVTDIAKNYTLIVVDTCKYTEDQTSTGLPQAEVGGMISDGLLKWVQDNARNAYAKGRVPIVLQHHAISPHFTGQERFGKNFIVDDFEKIGQAYADAGIKFVFTGHSHASDIATARTNNDVKVYDVMTSSLVGYPVSTRNVSLANESGKIYFDTKVDFLEEVEYIDSDTGKNIENVQKYAYERTMGKESTRVLLSEDTVQVALNKVNQSGGTKAAVANVLKVEKDNVTDEIVKMLLDKLPQSETEAKEFEIMKCKFGLFYDKDSNAIYLKQKVKRSIFNKMAVELYIPVEELKTLIDTTFVDVDKNIMNNKEGVNKVFQDIVNKAFTYKIDGKNTAYDYYAYSFNHYKSGIQSTEEEIEAVIGPIKKNKKYARKFIDKVILKTTKKDMVALLSKNELHLEKVIKSGNSNVTSKLIVKGITSIFSDMGDVWKKGAKMKYVPEAAVNFLNDTVAVENMSGMVIDSDVAEDNDFECVLEIVEN